MYRSLLPILSSLILLFSCSSKNTEDKSYSFYVAGHVYGSPMAETIGFYPPFKQQIDSIKQVKNLQFGMLTGDVVRHASEESWNAIDEDIKASEINTYFAVGNHDMGDRPMFKERYGTTDSFFYINNDVFIYFDITGTGWNVLDKHFALFDEALENVAKSSNIFVFTHQMLWVEEDNKYKDALPNSFDGKMDTINFWTEAIPYFNSLPNPVYWFAGDLGVHKNKPAAFYDNVENIHLIGSGMGGNYADNYLMVNVNEKNQVYINVNFFDAEGNSFPHPITDYRWSE